MNDFNLEEYILFIRSHILTKAIYLKTDVTEKLLEALCQFEVAPSVYLKEIIPCDSLSLKYKQIFDLANKKNSIWLNNWFLHSFGFKHCTKCNKTKTLDNYSINNKSADKVCDYCKPCSCKAGKAYRADNPNKIKAYNINNVDKIAKYHKAYRSNNADKIKAYKLANPDKRNAIQAKRRASNLQATPKWLTTEQLKQILTFYVEAKRLEQETGVKYHVDHIIPLQGSNVCGLHVPWNLQILSATENLSKGNKVINDPHSI
jgi:hypothetical protein